MCKTYSGISARPALRVTDLAIMATPIVFMTQLEIMGGE